MLKRKMDILRNPNKLVFGEDISIKIEKQFLLKSATTAFRFLWFSSSKSKRKIKPFRN